MLKRVLYNVQEHGTVEWRHWPIHNKHESSLKQTGRRGVVSRIAVEHNYELINKTTPRRKKLGVCRAIGSSTRWSGKKRKKTKSPATGNQRVAPWGQWILTSVRTNDSDPLKVPLIFMTISSRQDTGQPFCVVEISDSIFSSHTTGEYGITFARDWYQRHFSWCSVLVISIYWRLIKVIPDTVYYLLTFVSSLTSHLLASEVSLIHKIDYIANEMSYVCLG